ncbi:MAG: hypothetical protein DKM50_03830 [Candidatus Margulisiibacteriota bacterium]|nr:MAG: hypothetical protein A2X43_01545 [Candidatus Margulisbacteria bacterium GWD2_39_127]OGI04529.1 MAG: hypothetical protein A2X42_10400 [Candidatus Margulisbacteria bacterium GWF2_38_17]OGI07116.1 MAG: hypothetical protein A2X41_12780 [Candidatus Margulisbacteria bacterium GWE2_39_32]PZM82266.1 MAG: hypothetical protein DKM50_03830 [Candidatus Margulisiibacteriota bacterium]HAR62988.1 hypothetical protein [Candidatus Margulisiibacteriota bacterium]
MEKIFIVDDELNIRKAISEHILGPLYDCFTAQDGAEALNVFEKKLPDLVMLDIKIPKINGLTVLKKMKEISPETPVIIMTGNASIETAIEAMKNGAYDFLLKPFNIDKLKITVKNALETCKITRTNRVIQSEIGSVYTFDSIIGISLPMKKVFNLISKATENNVTVLIQGESGTGKELVAKEIHYNSDRKNKPFIAVNSTAIPESLLEHELFGAEKGSFTGAYQQTKGKFELADGGTIFLDEIGDIDIQMQSKLLRVIQEKEFYRIGGNEPVRVDVRIISATNKDLKVATDQGKFRNDLYYRLTVFPIMLPSLKERKEDIEPLTNHFLKIYSQKIKKKVTGIDSQALHAILNHDWPGNIRELENIIERGIILTKNELLTLEDVPSEIYKNMAEEVPAPVPTSNTLIIPLVESERIIILNALKCTQGNIRQAAKALGIDRSTLYRKLRETPDFRE